MHLSPQNLRLDHLVSGSLLSEADLALPHVTSCGSRICSRKLLYAGGRHRGKLVKPHHLGVLALCGASALAAGCGTSGRPLAAKAGSSPSAATASAHPSAPRAGGAGSAANTISHTHYYGRWLQTTSGSDHQTTTIARSGANANLTNTDPSGQTTLRLVIAGHVAVACDNTGSCSRNDNASASALQGPEPDPLYAAGYYAHGGTPTPGPSWHGQPTSCQTGTDSTESSPAHTTMCWLTGPQLLTSFAERYDSGAPIVAIELQQLSGAVPAALLRLPQNSGE